jgi:hypothetical protein
MIAEELIAEQQIATDHHAPVDVYSGYQCSRGHIFTELGDKTYKSRSWDSPDEHSPCCPICGSEDFGEVRICGECGEPVEKHEHTN